MRDEILNGTLHFPGNALFEKYPEDEQLIKRFWKAVWFNFLNNNDTNGLHWYNKMGIKLYNDVVRRLCHHKWLISHSLTGRKWASVELNKDKLLEFVTEDELESVKAEFKYNIYTLDFEDSTLSCAVKQNGQVRYTGLKREGFMAAGNTQFGFDMAALDKYKDAVTKNLTKSMDKIRDMYPEMKQSASSYDEVSVGIYEHHLANQMEVFTTGNNYNDSRGRAISQCLKKVFNPIGNKDARASLVITY